MNRITFIITLSVFVLSIFLVGFSDKPSHRGLFIFLPGTQPGIVDTIDNIQTCKPCHQSSTKPVTTFNDWYGSPMAQSARDPIFYSALAVANKYEPAVGEFCIRCHSPSGWLIGHSLDPMGKNLEGSDFDGIQCDFCHRLGNPLAPDSAVSQSTFPVPGFGNAMNVVQNDRLPKRGPYDDTNTYHAIKNESFQKQSEMCGTCHDISNPYYATDRINQAPHQYSPIERTYSEWLMSDYAKGEDSITCQGCHMSVSPGYGSIFSTSPFRTDLKQHDLTGGNTFLADILPDFWDNLNTTSLQAGKQRAITMLNNSATLELTTQHFPDSTIATVRVINLTGHKLPTGYPEGRRMWLQVSGFDESNNIIFQSGAYDTATAILTHDPQIKIYETIHGMTDAVANNYGLTPGSSFHFGLNDTILFDNRIPPKGFTNANFASRLASPHGYSYADSQYWDDTKYTMPSTLKSIKATLLYQTISKEYVEFLRDENVSNSADWNNYGARLYTSWQNPGKSKPVEMESLTQTITGMNDNFNLPEAFTLFQNYPNPFNPATQINFSINELSFLNLTIYDLLGNSVATLINEKKSPGNYTVSWDASQYPSGIYIATLSSNNTQRSIKILLMK